MEEGWARGRDGVRGLVAARQAYGQRPLGWCLEPRVGRLPLGPRPWAVRQAWETWGQPHGALPVWLETPGRTRQEPPRRWEGQRVVRRVPVEYAAGRREGGARRGLVGHSRQWAPQAAGAHATAVA
jgi:hypothetical protein